MTRRRIPKNAKQLSHKTLREGEHTGHAHVATADDVRLFIRGDDLFMSTPQGTEIVHQEHHPIVVPPGEKAIGAVREYDHFEEEARDVRD